MAFYPAMSMGERILFVRENCGSLSQEEFANRLGLTKSAISGYETGRRVPPDNVLKHIACVFHLDEDWLRDGVGEPFLPSPEDALEELFSQFDCSDFERSFLTAYFCLQDKDRRGFSDYLEQIFHSMVDEMKGSEPRSPAPEPVPPSPSDDDEAMKQRAGDLYATERKKEEKPGASASSANGSAVG